MSLPLVRSPRCRLSRALRIGATLLFLGGVAGCASWQDSGDPPINQVWHVVELSGQPIPRLPNGRVPALLFDGQTVRVSGFTGCNRLSGGYLLAGGSLEFLGVATTRMACSEAGATVEMLFMQQLEAVARWRRRGQDLELLNANGRVLMRLEEADAVDR